MWQSYVYAWMFTTMWVTWMYSAGCPALYVIAIVNFIVCYWVYKLLLVKHYQKSTEFDENFCMHTISYFKISIMWHVAVSLLMFTNFHTIQSSRIPEQYRTKAYEYSSDLFKDNPEMLAIALSIQKRFQEPIGFIYVCFIIFLFICYLLQKTLLKPI